MEDSRPELLLPTNRKLFEAHLKDELTKYDTCQPNSQDEYAARDYCSTQLELAVQDSSGVDSVNSDEADSNWIIELERGWSPWAPYGTKFCGPFDKPLRYRVGRAEFEAHFVSDREGAQTNLVTGKVRRLLRLSPGQQPPVWEGTGARRRPVSGGAPAPSAPPVGTAAYAAQASREVRRAVGGYPGGSTCADAGADVELVPSVNDAFCMRMTAGDGAVARSRDATRVSPARASRAGQVSPRLRAASPREQRNRDSSCSGTSPSQAALPRYMKPTKSSIKGSCASAA